MGGGEEMEEQFERRESKNEKKGWVLESLQTEEII